MSQPQPAGGGLDVVTGAFSYTGRFIARRLLADGRRVRTLTNHTRRPGIEDLLEKLEVEPLQFDDRARLRVALRGASTLYNTYWVRFPQGRLDFDTAVANTKTLLRAASEAGVKRVVHISVSNPSLDSPLAYYAGKAQTEEAVRESGLSWAIVRPTLVFANGDILINNIAWMLRHMPVFGIPGDGQYRVQPVSAQDVADIAVSAASQADDVTLDAAGPEIMTFAELVDQVAIAVNRKPRLMFMSPGTFILSGRVIGLFARDVVLTRQEVEGLMDELLVSSEPPRGSQRLDDWLLANANTIGVRYASELSRHFRR